MNVSHINTANKIETKIRVGKNPFQRKTKKMHQALSEIKTFHFQAFPVLGSVRKTILTQIDYPVILASEIWSR